MGLWVDFISDKTFHIIREISFSSFICQAFNLTFYRGFQNNELLRILKVELRGLCSGCTSEELG